MAHDVFISYSSKDKSVADAVCATLEGRRIRCWIAPRDVPPGIPYAAALVKAISASKVFVLVFSEGSNSSGAVMREVEEAVDNGIPIIPFRIEDIQPTEAMRFYIKSIHWIDAMSPPLERHLSKLADSVEAILSVSGEARPAGVVPPVSETPISRSWPLPTWATGLLALAAVAIVTGAAIWAFSRIGSGTDPSNVAPVAPSTAVASPTEGNSPEEIGADVGDATSASEAGEGWHALSFMIPNPRLWKETGEDRYTAAGEEDTDAFAWSTESFEGDLTIRFDLESPKSQSEGCVIVYGDGREYSFGSLIFCVESEFYQLEKHTRRHEGENFLAYAPSNIDFTDQVYAVEIEILGDVASMHVNGEKVLSTFFDTNEINRQGRIGLNKMWIGPEVTFSNIRVRVPADGGQDSTAPLAEEVQCAIDSGAPADYYPVESAFLSQAVVVDGRISSADEWSDATCVDFRMHYSINATNPDFQRVRWWVKNDRQDLYFLVRIPAELAARGAFVDYFWPEYTGSWAHSDGVYVNVDGEVFDHGQWDEMQWHEDEDLEPPGAINVEAANSREDDFYWFEIKRPLQSGDGNDWSLAPGQTVGGNPYDSFLIGIVMEEGDYMRSLQLELGEE